MYCVIFLIVTSLAGCFMHPLVNEPKCHSHSKFDYDEKLLSKLIRMEIAMENVIEKVEENDKQSALAIAEMRQATDDMSNNLKAQKESAEKSLVAAADKSTAASELAVAEMRQAVLEIENNLKAQKSAAEKSLEVAVEKAETAVTAIRQREEKSSVVFHVKDVKGNPTANHVIKFVKVVENTGGAYSLTTGCFTAPVQGVYWFSAHLCTKGGHQITPSIYIRDTLVSRVYVYDSSYNACGLVSAISTLQKNDEVCLKSGPYLNSSPLLKNDNYGIDNFMGALINKLIEH